MKIAILAAALLFASTAHAEDVNLDNYKPVWVEDKTRHRLTVANYALIAADLVTTKIALSRGARETGPIMRPLVSAVGVDGALAIDGLARLLLVHHLAGPKGSSSALAVTGALNAIVVANNIEALR